MKSEALSGRAPHFLSHQGKWTGRAGGRGNGRAGEVGSRPASRSAAHREPPAGLGGRGPLRVISRTVTSTLASTLAPLSFVPPGRWTLCPLLQWPSCCHPVPSPPWWSPQGGHSPSPSCLRPPRWPRATGLNSRRAWGGRAGAPGTPLPKGLSPGHCQLLGKQSKQGDT